jgi:GTPase SAR1 family protein
MSVNETKSANELTVWAKDLQELLKQQSDGSAAKRIGLAIDQLKTERFQIAVLGKAKRGKSTLINALLGRHDDTLAPIDKLPASSAISRFEWAENERAVVTFRDGRKEQVRPERIREFVTEEFNRENTKGVVVVDIQAPFAGLDHDLVLVDTPGAGSLNEHHDALLHAFIPQADAVIFLVTASMPLDQDEVELLMKVKQSDIQKMFFVMNKVDERSDADIEEAVRHNELLLSKAGIPFQQIHLISAKRAFQGDLADSKLPQLKREIDGFLAVHKGRVVEERFVSRVLTQVQPVVLTLNAELSAGRRSDQELNADLQDLYGKKQAIESERGLAEREFQRAWNLAVDRFEQNMQSARNSVAAEIASKIDRTPVTEVSKLSRELPTTLNLLIDEAIGPGAHDFERSAREASERLKASYPAVAIGDSGAIVLRTKESQTFVLGLAGGGAAAAAGVGVVSVGSAVAASIAAANAAALAATTTVAAPTFVSGLLTFAGLDILAPLATGTATVAAPAALTTTPLWVALSGPVGWTLAGIGLLAVPFAWRLSKLKLKEKLDEASREQVRQVFDRLRNERLAALRSMGKSIVEEFQIRLDRELQQIESAILHARDHRQPPEELARLEDLTRKVGTLIEAQLARLAQAQARSPGSTT